MTVTHTMTPEQLVATILRNDAETVSQTAMLHLGDGDGLWERFSAASELLEMLATAVGGGLLGRLKAEQAAAEVLSSTPLAIAFGAATPQPEPEDDAFADGYSAALDDARVISGRETLLECPEHGAAYYAGGECPVCAMNAAVAAYAAEPVNAYTEAQLDGNACISCGGDLTGISDGLSHSSRPAAMGPRGQMFVHSDAAVCAEEGSPE